MIFQVPELVAGGFDCSALRSKLDGDGWALGRRRTCPRPDGSSKLQLFARRRLGGKHVPSALWPHEGTTQLAGSPGRPRIFLKLSSYFSARCTKCYQFWNIQSYHVISSCSSRWLKAWGRGELIVRKICDGLVHQGTQLGQPAILLWHGRQTSLWSLESVEIKQSHHGMATGSSSEEALALQVWTYSASLLGAQSCGKAKMPEVTPGRRQIGQNKNPCTVCFPTIMVVQGNSCQSH